MRCPKCHYLSFDPEPRCKNCGYGFSLGDASTDLSLRNDNDDEGPLLDLNLREAAEPVAAFPRAAAAPAPPSVRPEPFEVESNRPALVEAFSRSEASAPRPAPIARTAPRPSPRRPVPAQRPSPAPTTELPLFVKGIATLEVDEEPVGRSDSLRQGVGESAEVSTKAQEPAAAPTAPPVSRKLGPLDRDLLEDLRRIERIEQREAAADARAAARAQGTADRVGPMPRAAAAALDALMMCGLATGVLWITLRWCDLPVAQAAVLPIVPTFAFLLLVGLGYLVMFTAAGGQTLGKMALGLRVVAEDAGADERRIGVGQAAYRAVLTFPSVLALGLGFIPALIGDERAVHDRLAHTRVVRA